MKKLATVALGLSLFISGIATSTTTIDAAPVAYSGTHYANALDYHNANEMDMADWENGDMFNCKWEPSNISFSNGIMDMKIDKSGNKYTGAEYRTKNYFGYGFYQVSMKPIKNDGVVSSFFTYTGPSDGTTWDEIDIEFLGKDTTHVQFNYYVDGRGGHEMWYDLGFDASESYHTYGFNWYEGGITWYVDGKPVYTATSATDKIPSHPGKIMLNVWNGIGVDDWLKPFNGRTGLHAYYDWFSWDKLDSSNNQQSNNQQSNNQQSNNQQSSNNQPSSGLATGSLFDSGKTYKIVNYNSHRTLDVDYGSMNNGANILQSTYNSYGAQKWIIEQQSNGYYIIKNAYTNKVLTVQDSANWDGANVTQWEYQGMPSQQWEIYPTRDNTFKIINRNSGKLLNVSWGSSENYANIEQYKDVDGNAQLWWIDVAN